MITAFHHPGYAAPLGDHQMPIAKFDLVATALREAPGIRIKRPDPATETDLLRVHTPDYIQAIRTGEPRSLAESQKFPWSPELFPSVCLTSGGCVAAGFQALRDGISANIASGFHHAHADHGEGFCTFNGLIVALDSLCADGEIRTAAVLDMDLHYGNGTSSLLESRPHFFGLSIYGNDYDRNTPYREVDPVRHSDGENHVSRSLPAGCDRSTMLRTLEESLPLILEYQRPDLLLYQAGADPYHEDPYSPLALNEADLKARDRMVFAFCRRERIPVAWVLAGGYTRDIRKIVDIHVNTFYAAMEIYA